MNEKIYKGTSKTLYQSDEDYSLILSFDDTLSVSKDKSLTVSGKGVLNNSISALLMQKLDLIGVENHLIKKTNMRQQLIQFVDIYPVQIHVCALACGRYVSDFGMEDGFVFEAPILDFRVKNRELGYPIINEAQMMSFSWLDADELESLKKQATRVFDFLTGLFAGVGIRLVDIKLEFGRIFNGEEFITILADEISPDTCRLWDMETNEKLCFEIAETAPEKIIPAYQEVLKRLSPKK